MTEERTKVLILVIVIVKGYDHLAYSESQGFHWSSRWSQMPMCMLARNTSIYATTSVDSDSQHAKPSKDTVL